MNEAVESTKRVIERLAHHHRNLVVAVVALVLASLLGAAFSFFWQPLVFVAALLPLCGMFMLLHSRLVSRWQEQILGMWQRDELDLDALASTVGGIRFFPTRTLQGLLAMLPTKEITGRPACDIAPLARQALGETCGLIQGCLIERTLFAAAAHGLGCAVLAWAVFGEDWHALWGLLLVVPILMCHRLPARWRVRRWLGKLKGLQGQGLKTEEFVAVAARLEWAPLERKEEHLGQLLAAGPSAAQPAP